jgi:hypothetical protein
VEYAEENEGGERSLNPKAPAGRQGIHEISGLVLMPGLGRRAKAPNCRLARESVSGARKRAFHGFVPDVLSLGVF